MLSVKQSVRTVDQLIRRNGRKVAAVQWACFVITCASYAGFIRLPELSIPAFVGLVLTLFRYAVWESWLRQRVVGDGSVDDRTAG